MFDRSVGKKPGADHRLLAHEHRRQDGDEPRATDVVEREPVQREREQRGVADEVAEARAREARCALELEPPDLRRLARAVESGSARRSA